MNVVEDFNLWDCGLVPVLLPNHPNIPPISACGASVCPGGEATQISAGGYYTCARLAGGGVDCWGLNDRGQAEDYKQGDETQVTAGAYHACALLTSGDVHCYGENDHSQAQEYRGGDATQVSATGHHTCALLTSGDVHCWGADGDPQPDDYRGGDAIQVTAGMDHTCVLLTEGDVQCWGVLLDFIGPSFTGDIPDCNDLNCDQLPGGEDIPDCNDLNCGDLVPGRDELPGGDVEGTNGSASVPAQQTPGVPGQSVPVPEVPVPATCTVNPCNEGTQLVPGGLVTTPPVTVNKTCTPFGTLCIGSDENPITLVPSQSVPEDNVTAPAVCSAAGVVCLESQTVGGGEEGTPGVDPVELTPAIQVAWNVSKINSSVSHNIGEAESIGPTTVTVPTPFGDVPVTVCAEPSPVCRAPNTDANATVETELTVTVTVGEASHTQTVPVTVGG